MGGCRWMRLGWSAACADGGGRARQGWSGGKLLPKLLPPRESDDDGLRGDGRELGSVSIMTDYLWDGGVEPRWQLDLAAAEAVIEAALAQREADRARDTFVPNEWAGIAAEVYAWKRAKTYLAAVLCGLVARATDGLANPLSLQIGEDASSRGYAATSLWQVIQAVAQGRIDLRQLKSQPFNNSPFSGKRYLSTDWENVAAFNRPVLARTVELMELVARMSRLEAGEALRSFLWAVPEPVEDDAVVIDLAASRIDLAAFFDALDTFLLDDGENGRRAQAMVAAALALVHGQRVDTPRSVNDPSRSLAGDVRVVGGSGSDRRVLFAEAKQKLTLPEWVSHFADEIRGKESGGVGAYAALVNARAMARSRRSAPLPEWRSILSQSGVLMTIWDNPADMLREALVWSALDVREGVGRFVELYVQFLRHVEVEQPTVDEWLQKAAAFGVVIMDRTAR